METKVKTVGQKFNGGVITVTRSVEETLTEQDVLSMKNQLMFGNANIKAQMQALKKQYDENTQKIAEYDEMLKSFSAELPGIE